MLVLINKKMNEKLKKLHDKKKKEEKTFQNKESIYFVH